jgi:hypothetical protein
MTTRELADLLDQLKQGLGALLRPEASKAFDEAAAAFRELPDQQLKKVAEQLRKANEPATPAAGKKAGKSTVDVPALIQRIRAARSGTATDGLPELASLTNTQLREVLAAFGEKPTTKVADNLTKVRKLLHSMGDTNGTHQNPAASDSTLIAEGVRLYNELRDTRGLSIEEVRTRFAPLREHSKSVLEAISRGVGYTPQGSRKDILDRLQNNLEDIKMHQLRSELVGSGA